MKARSPFALGFLVLLCAAATSSFAGEGKTYKIDMQDRWKAGDVVTKTSKDVESNHVTVKGPDGAVVQEKNTTTTITAELIEKAVEVDEKDRISKGLLYVVRCEIDAEGAKDESLSGAQFEFSGVGKLRSWKLLTPGKELTDPAKEWLDKEPAFDTWAKARKPVVWHKA